MKRTTIAAIALPCLFSAGIAYSFVSDPANANTSSDGQEGADESELHAEVQRLKRELASRRAERVIDILRATQQQDPNLTDPDDGVAEEAQDESIQVATSPGKRAFTEQEAADRLENRFASEAVDTAWRSEAAPILRQQFSDLAGAGTLVTGIDCRQSLCRVDMVHKDLDTLRDFGREMVASEKSVWRGAGMMHVVGDPEAPGELRVLAYMARPGVDLAQMMMEDP